MKAMSLSKNKNAFKPAPSFLPFGSEGRPGTLAEGNPPRQTSFCCAPIENRKRFRDAIEKPFALSCKNRPFRNDLLHSSGAQCTLSASGCQPLISFFFDFFRFCGKQRGFCAFFVEKSCPEGTFRTIFLPVRADFLARRPSTEATGRKRQIFPDFPSIFTHFRAQWGFPKGFSGQKKWPKRARRRTERPLQKERSTEKGRKCSVFRAFPGLFLSKETAVRANRAAVPGKNVQRKNQPGSESAGMSSSPSTRSEKRVRALSKSILTSPIWPLRCLATSTMARRLSSMLLS